MFISVSKIQFESKSQQMNFAFISDRRCLSVCQRYNLKANHNDFDLTKMVCRGVYQCVKDTIWKQITTEWVVTLLGEVVFISVSKIQFESKSQPFHCSIKSAYRCLSVCQRYNLKANHNIMNHARKCSIGVYQCVKDTIWKQITTRSLE